MQRYRCYANISMDVSAIANVTTTQHHGFYASISMNASAIANVITMQCYRCYPNIPLDTFIFIYVATMQRRKRYTCISMNTSPIVNVITMQLGTSCSFDSPGLARNEPTPGEHPQGDSTPSVLSFFCEGTLTMEPFMVDYSKKAQHLWRCSPHNIR